MSAKFKLPGWLLLLFVAGCQSDGSHPQPPRSNAGTSAGVASSPRPPGVAEARAESFTEVTAAQPIRPEWLKPPAALFRLGPGDAIDIEILGEPGTQATAIIGPDGKLYYSLLPGIFVWGLTLSETKAVLENTLAKYIRVKPEVGLTLRSVGSQRIWILGSVQRPGVYALATPMTLLETISAAGGAAMAPDNATELADLENSFLLRGGQILNVDFSRLLRHGDWSQNLYLQPDDLVYLRSATSREIYVLGAVAIPNVLDYSSQSSLASAVAAAGGTIPTAYSRHVAIVRGSLSHPRITTIDYEKVVRGQARDVRLEPGDIVYVPFSPFRKLEQLAEQILSTFVRTIAINEGRNAVQQNGVPVGVTVPIASP